MMPVFMNAVAPARSDGLSAEAGTIPGGAVFPALLIAGIILLLTLGLAAAILSAVLLALLFFLCAASASARSAATPATCSAR